MTKHFKTIFFLGLLHFSINSITLQPTIIVLQRVSCSGKTSLCNSVTQLSSKFEVICEDDLLYEIVNTLLEKHFPNECKKLSNYIQKEHMFNAIVRREITYKKELDRAEKNFAITIIRNIETVLNDNTKNKAFNEELDHLVEETRNQFILECIEKKQHVIVDSWLKKTNYYKERFPTTPVISIFAYTPLPRAFNFFEKRNLQQGTGSIKNRRFYNQLISGYVNCYKLSPTKTNSTIEALPKKAIEKVFDSIEPHVPQDWYTITSASFSQRELNLARLQELRKTFLPETLNNSDTVYIELKDQYDYIIKTGFQTPTESAQQLIDIVENNVSNDHPHEL